MIRTHDSLRRRSRRRYLQAGSLEELEARTLLSTFLVTSTDDNNGVNPAPGAGTGTLRQAIVDVNADPGSAVDTIDFAIPGSGVHTIRPVYQLPKITHPVAIDGYSQPGASRNTLAVGDNAVLLIELDGNGALNNPITSEKPAGLYIMAGNSTVTGLVVHDFAWTGIELDVNGGNTIEGNFIGTDPTGEATGVVDGVYVPAGGSNLIGTNGDGIGDYAERNVIGGVALESSYNIVAGNYIGTNARGTRAIGNPGSGVLILQIDHEAGNNRIGVSGHDANPEAERNIVSGNSGVGVLIQGSGHNIVSGNYIGTDVTGSQVLPNGDDGLRDQSLGYNIIGSDGDGVGDAFEMNVISGNAGYGVVLSTSYDLVAGNRIGTDVTGTQEFGNQQAGISISTSSSTGNTIGGSGPGQGNLISGNGAGIRETIGAGIHCLGSATLIQGNRIGTDVSGQTGLGNVNGDGISLANGSGSTIGGTAAGAGNLISGNGRCGIWIGAGSTASSGNLVQGNVIESNGHYGVLVGSGSAGNTIGGTASGAGNTIASNHDQGVVISGATTINNPIRGNATYGNGWPDIDLAGDGPTANTPGGPHVGPNRFQNFPVITTALAGATEVAGTLNSIPSTSFALDFFADGRYLGSGSVQTDASGNGSFDVPGLGATVPGQYITATATDPDGNTSEYSAAVQLVQVATSITLTASAASPLLGDTVTFTAAVGASGVGASVPSGQVDFYADGILIGSGLLAGSGVATFSTSALTVGAHSITAVYTGSPDFLASTSAPTAINVQAPSSISGVAFEDFNNDGEVDFGEQGIPGVSITLTGTDDLGNAVNLNQLTDGDGAYVFLNLRPGCYTIVETQPNGYTQGINEVGTAGGTVALDQFDLCLAAGLDALNYNYGERPAATGAIQHGQTAGIGFWNNKNGQALIKALNGGTGTQLGDWLAVTFPHMFGASAGGGNLAGKGNAFIAALFQSDFVVHGTKLDAQVLATALAVYVTDGTLDSTGVGTQYGFVVGGNGVATATFNVGSNGAAFGVADNSVMTVMDLLLAADAQAANGVLYGGNATLRNKANNVFSAINQAGGL
jgi:parallel beta-helix repeat protein